MSVKMSQEIPEIFDISNQESLRQWMIAVKQCIEELARKAQDRQMEIRSTVPTTNDIEEGTFVAYVNGATIRIYTKQSGTINYWTLS